MSEIIQFRPRAEVTAEQNLSEYIEFAKQYTLIDDWEADTWDLTSICGSKNLKKRCVVNFQSNRKTQPITPSFLEGVKALYSELIRRKKPKEFRRQLNVLKMIEQVLLDLNRPVCISQIDAIVLDEWAMQASKGYKDPWNLGREVQSWVDNFINPGRLTPTPIQWKSPFAYKQPKRRDRLGKQHEEIEGGKLPNINSIIAIAEVANESKDEIDQMVCSFVKLAMFAPSRISEILTLPLDCITEAQADSGTLMGIKWRPVKGGQVITKFAVSETAEEMARAAIKQLTTIGEHVRSVAAWYEKKPDKIYLPPELEHLRGKPVTWYEFSQIIGRDKHSKIKAASMVEKYGINPVGTTRDTTRWPKESNRSKYNNLYSFDDIEQWILKRIPDLVIDSGTGLTLQNALFCIPVNYLRPGALTLHNIPDIVSISQIDHQLGNNPNGRTIFSRNNKLAPSGEPWKLTSHQFRHLLNTLAQSKYLNQSLIAFWSGRKSVKQNDWYNHLEQDAFIEAYTKLSAQTPDIGVEGPIKAKAESIAKENMISYREALSSEIKSIHITRYGICRHDWALTPCPKDKDCINCGDHLFMKGEEKHLNEAIYQLELHEKAVHSAKQALDDNRPGAKRWLENNEPKLFRWKLAVEKLTDSSIPDRTLISLPPPEHSQTQVGLTCLTSISNNEPAINENDDDSDLLNSIGML